MKLKPMFNKLATLMAYVYLRLERLFFKVIIFGLVYASLATLLMLLMHYASTFQFQAVGVAAVTPLAIMIAFAGLLYNRTRAINSPRKRFRSFYAAERMFAASFYYLVAVILGFVATVALTHFKGGPHFPQEGDLMLWYLIPVLFSVGSFSEIVMVFLALFRKYFAHNRHPKTIIRQIRKLER